MKHTTILYIVIAGLLIALFFCLRGCSKQPTDGLPPGTSDSLQTYKNSLGETVSALKTTREELAKERVSKDSLAKLYKTKPKYIKDVTTVYLEGKEIIVPSGPPEIIRDTVEGLPTIIWYNQAFENDYHVAMVKINHRDKDSSLLELSSVDTIDIVGKVVKEGNIFNRKEYYQIDVKNRNPYTTITAVNAYRTPPPRPKKFGLGFQVGYGFSGTAPKPYVGVGISYNLIRF